jgi:hypothetical protein
MSGHHYSIKGTISKKIPQVGVTSVPCKGMGVETYRLLDQDSNGNPCMGTWNLAEILIVSLE